MWPAPILVGCIFAPESPWWLVRKGRHEDARRSVQRLHQNPTEQEVEDQVSYMIHTNAIEKSLASGTSYWQCFRGTDLRRTEVAAGVWSIQNLCGSGQSTTRPAFEPEADRIESVHGILHLLLGTSWITY